MRAGANASIDSDVGRSLVEGATTDPNMTNELCTKYCFGRGYPYAGTEYATECYCGTKLATGATKKPETDCSSGCGGNVTEACGGPTRLTVYKTDQITGPAENPGVGNWASMGCYT